VVLPPRPFGDEPPQSRTDPDARVRQVDVDPESESAQSESMDGEWDGMGPEAVMMSPEGQAKLVV